MKRVFNLLLFLVFIFILNAPVYAAPVSIESASFVPSKVVFNGAELSLWRDPLVGVVRSGETNVRHYMPLEGVLEQMGYIVNFDNGRNIINVITQGNPPDFHVPSVSSSSTFASGGIRAAAYNDFTLVINGMIMDFPDDNIISVLRGTEAHPTFFMPLRPVLEYLGYYVGWDSENSTVIVASDEFFSGYGTLKAAEPAPPENTELEGEAIEPETLDDGENATEPLPSADMSPEEVTIFDLDDAVADAIAILTENLQDPSSLTFHEIRYTGDEVIGYAVYIDFSSRNALGGYVRRIAEVSVEGGLVVEGETQVEGAADNTVFYTAVRMAFQSANPYEEYDAVEDISEE